MSVLKRGTENRMKKCRESGGPIEHIQYKVAILNWVVRGYLNKNGENVCTQQYTYLENIFFFKFIVSH